MSSNRFFLGGVRTGLAQEGALQCDITVRPSKQLHDPSLLAIGEIALSPDERIVLPDKIEGIKDQCFAAGTSNGNRQAASKRRRKLEGIGSLGIPTKVKGETLFGATSGINDNHGVGSGSVVLDVGIPNQVSHVLKCRDIGDMALRGSLPTAILR